MNDDVILARVGKVPMGEVADKAARLIAGAGRELAVSLDPEGYWLIEPPETAIAEEIVGVYRGDQPFTLCRLIDADMRHVWECR